MLGGARMRAGCGKWQLRGGRPPAALLFVWRRAAPFRALQWVRGLSARSADKVVWAAGGPAATSIVSVEV